MVSFTRRLLLNQEFARDRIQKRARTLDLEFETEPIRVTAPADLGLLPDAHEQVQDDCHIDPDNRGLKDARFVHYFIDFKRKK